MLNIPANLLEDQYSSGVYIKRDLQIVRGEGAILYDVEGKSYIDCVGGQGAANFGHAHPAIVQAIQSQITQLISCPELFHNPVRAHYQAELCRMSNMARVFLCNSGTEAVEAAIKFACVATGRHGIVATMRAFHGRTLGALSTTWNKQYREPFALLLNDVRFAPYNQIERIAALLDDTIAAVIVEPVQGEGGVYPAQDGYLSALQDMCRANGTLLIIDEIQTGFGRTGSLFTYQAAGIQPDLVCLAKSIAGGLPMGAVLMNESIGEIPPALHGSTFGGNPVACAAGLAVLDILQNTDVIAQTQQRGAEILAYLQVNLPTTIVNEVRGQGLLIGIELNQKVAPILQTLQARGVLALPAGKTVLRLLPPLVISDHDLWQAIHTIEEVLHHAVH